jgi:flagellar biosynthetic protein FliR
MSGVMMLMLLDLPQAVVVGVVDSYAVLPLGASPSATTSLDRHAGLLAAGLVTSVQVAAPFLVYAVVVNGLFAVLGRMVPQIQSYFLSGPFLAIGGLALLYLVFGEIMRILMEAVPARAWL